jgi:hypothetical protein
MSVHYGIIPIFYFWTQIEISDSLEEKQHATILYQNMPKQSQPHSYSDKITFDRLLVLIATLVKYPGVGYYQAEKEDSSEHHNALLYVQEQMQIVAKELNLVWAENYPSTPTIRKDLQTLKDYMILDRRMYRWGYYLDTGVMNFTELSYALDALSSQAKYQGDPRIREVNQRVNKRLKGLNLEHDGRLFYPLRQQINSSIVYTDPSEMIQKGKYRHTLFDRIEEIEDAILAGKKWN